MPETHIMVRICSNWNLPRQKRNPSESIKKYFFYIWHMVTVKIYITQNNSVRAFKFFSAPHLKASLSASCIGCLAEGMHRVSYQKDWERIVKVAIEGENWKRILSGWRKRLISWEKLLNNWLFSEKWTNTSVISLANIQRGGVTWLWGLGYTFWLSECEIFPNTGNWTHTFKQMDWERSWLG